MRILISKGRTHQKNARNVIFLAIVACLTVISGTVLLHSVESLLTLFLVCFIVLVSLLLIFDRNRLLENNVELDHKDQLLEAIADVYWQWDLSNGVFNYDQNLLKMLSYPKNADSDPGFWKVHTHPVDRPQQKYQLFRHLSDESAPYYSEYRIQDASGGKIVLRDNSGKPLLMCGSLDCIQERKDLEQSLIHAHKMDALGQLTEGIAHDFNNILASILGYTELALDTNIDSKISRYLEQIQLAGNRTKSVLKQLLDFGRHSKADTKVICLQTEIHETLKMLESTFPSTIQISESIPPGDYYLSIRP